MIFGFLASNVVEDPWAGWGEIHNPPYAFLNALIVIQDYAEVFISSSTNFLKLKNNSSSLRDLGIMICSGLFFFLSESLIVLRLGKNYVIMCVNFSIISVMEFSFYVLMLIPALFV